MSVTRFMIVLGLHGTAIHALVHQQVGGCTDQAMCLTPSIHADDREVDIAIFYIPRQKSTEESVLCLQVLHRLDMETTGVILFAKSAEVCAHIHAQFRNRSVQKQYLAITLGNAAEATVRASNIPTAATAARHDVGDLTASAADGSGGKSHGANGGSGAEHADVGLAVGGADGKSLAAHKFSPQNAEPPHPSTSHLCLEGGLSPCFGTSHTSASPELPVLSGVMNHNPSAVTALSGREGDEEADKANQCQEAPTAYVVAGLASCQKMLSWTVQAPLAKHTTILEGMKVDTAKGSPAETDMQLVSGVDTCEWLDAEYGQLWAQPTDLFVRGASLVKCQPKTGERVFLGIIC
jgi:hypothetical protein